MGRKESGRLWRSGKQSLEESREERSVKAKPDADKLPHSYRLVISGSWSKAPGFNCLHGLFIEPVS
jgi:hypothetical protein